MSGLMKLFGWVLLILGIALASLVFQGNGWLQVHGIQMDTASILLVGGILALGLAGVMDRLGKHTHEVAAPAAAAPVEVAPAPAPTQMPNFKSRAAETAGAAVAAGAAMGAVAASAKPAASVNDTVSALEQAKADIIKSMGGMDSVTAAPAPPPPPPPKPAAPPPPPPPPIVEEVADEEEGDPDLYVVEEKVIRGRPARVLSDNTVEAETDEGWMRFEDINHLNEYLDSVEEQS